MATVQLNVRFGKATFQNDPSPFTISAEITQQKIQSHYKKYSTLLSKHRLPLVVVQLPAAFQKLQLKMIDGMLQGKAVPQTLIKGQRCYRMYDNNDPEMLVVIKKLQKMLSNLTQLNNSLQINLTFFDLTRKRKELLENNTRFLELALQNLIINARLDLDGQFVSTLGSLIGKISPGFEESPIIGFLELFQEASLDLQFENPSILKEATRKEFFPQVMGFEESSDDEGGQMLKKLLECQDKITVYVHAGKLGYLKFTGEARIWAYFFCIATM